MGKWGHQDNFRPVYIFYKKIPHAQKAQKLQKGQKAADANKQFLSP